MKRLGVLFLCTGNSARSLMAESALARLGGDRFVSLSAGSHPKAAPHPVTLRVLEELGYDTSRLRSKSWDELAAPGAPSLDFVFTVCDRARDEVCPAWAGAPVSAHWGVDDPAAFEGSEEEMLTAFRRAHDELERRVRRFVALPLESLSGEERRLAVEAIGEE